ncbi:MAG: helix-turn-helix domain-containing protein [Panacagrimonas sp.]
MLREAMSGYQPGSGVAVWRFDPVRWTLTTPSGYDMQLSMAECVVIDQLLGRAGLATSREHLRAALDRHHIRLYSRNLDSLISRLRRKVERTGREKLPIQAARNIGYVFTGRSETTAKPQAAESITAQRAQIRPFPPQAIGVDAGRIPDTCAA